MQNTKIPRLAQAEDNIQSAIFEWLGYVAPHLICFHVPNGGLRSRTEAARFKRLGVVPGVPDLVTIDRDGIARFLEIKTENGSLSKAQRDLRDRLIAMRVPFAVARSIDDARLALDCWGVSTREAHQ